MRSTFAVLFLSLAFSLCAHAQKASVIDFDSIRTNVEKQNSALYYPQLMKRYVSGDTSLTLKEYKYLYYGYSFQPGYDPYTKTDKKEFYQLAKKGKYDEAIDLGKKLLEKDPFNIDILITISACYRQLDQLYEAKVWRKKWHSLTHVILLSGDGRSCNTAYVVIDPDHCYSILSVLSLESTKHSEEGACETFTIKTPNDENISSITFNTARAQSKRKEK